MNWVVYADGEVLARSGIADPVYAIHTPEVKLELNKAGSFQFSIYPPHPYYNRLFKMKTRIDVVLNGETIFGGRVLYTNVDLRLQKKVYCEGALSYLLDTIQESHDFDSTITQYYDMTVYEFLDRILVKHNKLLIHDPAKILENEEALSQLAYDPNKPGSSPTSTDTTSDLHRVLMDTYPTPMWNSLNPSAFSVEDKTKFFKIGQVNAEGTSDKFKFEVKGHQKTLDMILETLVDTVGGYMRCTRDPEDGWYVIDWMDNFGSDNFQPIEFGSNLIELEQDESGVEIFTRLYPTGKPSTSSSSSGEEKTSYLVTRILKCDDVLDEEHQREYPDDPTYTGSHLEEDHGIIVRGVEFSDINPGFEYLVQPYQDEHAYAKDAYVLEGSDVFQAVQDMAADDEHPAPENDPNEEYWHRLTAEELEDKTNAMSDAEKLLSIQGQLLKRAKKYIIENCTVLPEQLTLTAIDLRNLAVNYSQMTIGRKIHVYSPPHGIDRNLMCIGISYNLEDPSKNTYTITSKRNGSDAVPRFSQQTRSATKSGRSGAGGGGATDSDGHVNGIGSGGGGGGAATKEDVQQVAAWVQYWAGVETDNEKYYKVIAKATGLQVDENGNPIVDSEGNWAWDQIDDPNAPRNTLSSMVDVKADSATMRSELNAHWTTVTNIQPTDNPREEGWYEVVQVPLKDDPNTRVPSYKKTADTVPKTGKQYFRRISSTENNIIASGSVQVQPGSVLIQAINQNDPSTITLDADQIDLHGAFTYEAGSGVTLTGEIINATDVLYAHAVEIWQSGDTYTPALTAPDVEDHIISIADGEEDQTVPGKINFTYTCADGETTGTFSFDQADTQFYQAGVSAAKNAVGLKLVAPSGSALRSQVQTDTSSTPEKSQVNITADLLKTGTITIGQQTFTLGYDAANHNYLLAAVGKADNEEVAYYTGRTGTEAYVAGETAGKNAMGLKLVSVASGSALTPKIEIASGYSTKTYTVYADLEKTGTITVDNVSHVLGYDSSTHKYNLAGVAKLGSTAVGYYFGSTGTEAYDDGAASASGKTLVNLACTSIDNISGTNNFKMTFTGTYDDATTDTFEFQLNTSLDASTKKIGEVSGTLSVSCSGKSKTRNFSITAPKVTSASVNSAGLIYVNYNRVNSGPSQEVF